MLENNLFDEIHDVLVVVDDWKGTEPGKEDSPVSFTGRSFVRTDVAKLESGHTPSRRHPEYWNGGIPWISLQDTEALGSLVVTNTHESVKEIGLDNSSARLLPKGTVVFSRTASVGLCSMMGRDMATSQDFANYICGEKLDPRYLVQLFRNMGYEWERQKQGSTHKTIYMPIFKLGEAVKTSF